MLEQVVIVSKAVLLARLAIATEKITKEMISAVTSW